LHLAVSLNRYRVLPSPSHDATQVRWVCEAAAVGQARDVVDFGGRLPAFAAVGLALELLGPGSCARPGCRLPEPLSLEEWSAKFAPRSVAEPLSGL
jgi:hypothetical protein